MQRVMDSDLPVYPEHDKMKLIAERSQSIYDFMEWMQGKGFHLLKWHEFDDGAHDYITPPPMVKLLAEFFDIDLDKIEREKRAMLDYMRGANSAER